MYKIIKVVVAKAKLSGDESVDTIQSMLAAHHTLRNNGFIRNTVTCSANGLPEYIVSMWEISDSFPDTSLPTGLKLAYILQPEPHEIAV